MMLRWIVLICAIVAKAAPTATLEWTGMNARRAYLEDDIFASLAPVEPEEILGYVVELKESIYEQMPLAPSADQSELWVRELVGLLHEIGKVDSKNCSQLERYIGKVNKMIEEIRRDENLVNFAKFYHQKQLALCS